MAAAHADAIVDGSADAQVIAAIATRYHAAVNDALIIMWFKEIQVRRLNNAADGLVVIMLDGLIVPQYFSIGRAGQNTAIRFHKYSRHVVTGLRIKAFQLDVIMPNQVGDR